MAYGKIKADTLVFDNSGSDVELAISTIPTGSLSNYAPLAGAAFTGGITGTTAGFTGNVGIGTTSPAQGPLHVHSSTTTAYFHLTNSTTGSAGSDGFSLFVTGNDTVFNQRESANMRFFTANSERLRINSSGNVGIGTVSPNNYSGYKTLTIDATNGGVLDFKTNTTDIGSIYSTSSLFQIQAQGSTIPITFRTNSSERMRIDSSGRVAIGTSSALSGSKLTIAGNGLAITGQNGDHSANSIRIGEEGSGLAQIRCYGPDTSTNGSLTLRTCRSNGLNNKDVTFDSSGRLLVGTTTEGAANEADNVTISGTDDVGITLRSTNSAINRIYFSDGTSGTSEYAGYQLYNHSSNAMIFGTDASERMRIDSSGNLHIANSANSGHGNRLLQIGDTARNATYLELRTSTTGDGGLLFSDGTAANDSGYRGTVEYSHSTDFMQFKTAAVARMRIDADGMMRVRGTATSGALNVFTGQSAASNINLILGQHSSSSITNGTLSFLVLSNGNIQNTNNSYGAISDSKLKENIVDAGSQWDDFKAVRFRKYNFKEETGHETFTQLGVIAQELELVSPGLVTETPDLDEEGNDLGTTTKGIKYSILTNKALVALQEAMERIETLEAEVKALKAG